MTLDILLEDPAFRLLVSRFLGDLGERVKGIEDAAAGGDQSTLIRLAHQLAGTGGGFGFSRISGLAGEIERLGQASAPIDRLNESIGQLRTEADTAMAEWEEKTAVAGSLGS